MPPARGLSVDLAGAQADTVPYLERPFDGTGTDDFRVTRFTLSWARTWKHGGAPR